MECNPICEGMPGRHQPDCNPICHGIPGRRGGQPAHPARDATYTVPDRKQPPAWNATYTVQDTTSSAGWGTTYTAHGESPPPARDATYTVHGGTPPPAWGNTYTYVLRICYASFIYAFSLFTKVQIVLYSRLAVEHSNNC